MATKLSRIKELAAQATKQLTASPENWTSYLDTASGLYRYPFSDQLLIYAQRPDATACASIELWNQKLNRWIKKGSKGIALLDDSGRKTELKYVFDIADTQNGWYNPRRPYLWKMQEHHHVTVTEELSVNYDIPVGGLSEMLLKVAEQSAEDFILENKRDIVYTVEDSFLEELDEYNVEVLFRQTLTNSIAYSLVKRCGLDTSIYFTNEDFVNVRNFNTIDTVTALGTATSTLSEQILMNIGRTVRDFDRAFYQKQQLSHTIEKKPTERSQQHEQSKQRTGLHTERGLSDSQPDIRPHRRRNRKVRDFTERLSEKTQGDPLQSIASERGTGQPFSRGTADRRTKTSPDDRTGISETAGTGQSPKSPEMDAAHEHPETASGGNRPDRTHLQLEQTTIDSVESDSQKLSDFLMSAPVSLKAVNELLRAGSNKKNSTLRICSFYKRQHTAEENIAFLKQEYQTGGKGIRVEGKELSAWFDESGITLATGNTALQSPDNLLITWEQVDRGIRELLDTGQYLPQIELDMADTNEITETASKLWNLYRDSDHNIPEEWNENGSGYPDSVAEISRRLSQADSLKEIVQKVQTDLADGQINFYRWSKPAHVLQAVTDLQREPLNFIADEAFTSEHEQFITQDEVDAYFTRGSSFSQGKFRIYSYFLHEHTSKEKADFLKNEYGTGGSSHALSGADNSYGDHDSKGIRLSRGKIGTSFDEVKLSWPNAVKRIDKLISQERYMNTKELAYIPEYEKEIISAEIYRFFYNSPENIVCPYPYGAEYDEALKNIRPQLDSPDKLAEIIESMHPIYENLKEDDRDYQGKRDIYHEVISFQNGTFTLFPSSPVTEKESVHSNEPIEPDSKELYRQLSLFPTEQEQKESISRAEKKQYPAFNADLLADALRYDRMMHIKKPEIKAYFAEHASAKKQADFLKTAYNTEFSLFDVGIPEQRIGYHVEEQGLYLWEGNYLSRTSGSLYTWNELQEKVADLLNANAYLEQPLAYQSPTLDTSALPFHNNQLLYDMAPFLFENDSIFVRFDNSVQARLTIEAIGKDRFALSFNDASTPMIADPYIEFVYDRENALISGRMFHSPTLSQKITAENENHELINKDIEHDINNSIQNWMSEYKNLNPVYHEISGKFQPENEASEIIFGKMGEPMASDGNFKRIQAFADKYGIHLPEIEQDEKSVSEAESEIYSETETQADTIPSPTSRNYKIKDENLGVGGQKTKYGYNAAAIRTLKTIEAENRQAALEEQELLAKYVGWGGLAQAFDKNNERWEKEYTELKELLTDEEYSSARSSTLNAHYTSPAVIQSIYEALGKMGFRTGNVLEPAMGVGNFFGMLPESMAKSKLYGVEIDSISGRIARQLYPKADIQITGFEKTDFPDSFFDVAIGNIPFGSYKVPDKDYDKQNLYIHDYFIAKTLDKVRPGGIVAFVTSKGTLDKANPDFRKYLACRAELVGAVRLPNIAFKDNAGTEVTSDILFFQKRDRMIDIEPDWVHLNQTKEGVPVNSYFTDNPHMMLGTMVQGEEYSLYGNGTETACIPFTDSKLNLSEQLTQAMNHVYTQIDEINLDDLPEMEKERESILADPEVRNYSFCIMDDEIYYRENSRMYKQDLSGIPEQRVRHLIKLRDTVNTLIHYQMENYSDFEIKRKQHELNTLYDDFTKRYGLISNRGNSLVFSDDPSYYLLCSLEVLDDEGNFKRKADMFHKRTIKKKEIISHVDTASEALAVSLSEKACVDLDYMHSLSGIPHEQIVKDLEGVIFRLPAPDADTVPIENASFVTADEYLSGNVREKLLEAKQVLETSDQFHINVKALEKAQPKDLEAYEIDVRLGSTWIEQEYIQQFTYELLQTPESIKNAINVHYSALTSRWNVEGKSVDRQNVLVNESYGTGRANAYRIIEDTLNLRDVRIYDTIEDADGKERRVLNRKETMLAQQKQELIKQKFRDWIFDDSDRRDYLVHKYNTKFNCIKPREYDGSHITFNGMNPDIHLEKHQVNAVARGLYGGKTLLAHEVGAGKTFEMIAIAMESKRLGLSQKALFAVPNHLTEQTASEFLRLYPSANILVARKKDFETANRKKFCARIATGDYDAVIMGHSQFEKIPISKERQERLLQEQIDEISDGIAELKEQNGERFSIKDMERTKKSLEAKLERLNDTSRKDDTVTFEQLGVDRLVVDESHNYKNLFLVTKMRNVAGLSTSDAQKSSDLFMKCRYIDEVTNGKGIVFATGTPISNSMTELYTVMRYLMYDYLKENDLLHFDAWASMFGETVTAMELAPEGNGYRSRTRFARFFNLPELMNIFKEVADIKMADELNLDRPDAVYQNIVAKPTEHQKELIAGLSDRAAAIHNGAVDPSQDNMLKITTDGRKIGLDQRLINPLLPDDENSKTNLCMQNIYQIWEDNKDTKAAQLAFCDFSTPSKDKFNVYDDIRGKLIEKGIPENEIAYIHDANTDAKKKELFAKVRSGQVRVLFGSTQKMGAGTNVQDRLIAIHDLDAPWRPADLSQRAGRIVRRGNMFKEVHIFRYVTEDSFDSYLYQTLENKQKFISQIMTSKTPLRSCEDMDETALNFAEIKALCAGNPLIKEKMELETDLVKLKVLRANYQSQRYRLEDKLLKYYPQAIQTSKALITGYGKDIEYLRIATCKDADGFSPMTLFAREYTDKEQAGKALLTACKKMNSTQAVKIGTYRGFEMHLSFEGFDQKHVITLKHDQRYKVELGDDVFGNITRLNNALEGIADRLHKRQQELESLHQQQENTKAELDKPFDKEAEFQAKNARYIELDALLNIETDKLEQAAEPDSPSPNEIQTEPPPASQTSKKITPASGRTSVLQRLEAEKANVYAREQQKTAEHKQPALEAVM